MTLAMWAAAALLALIPAHIAGKKGRNALGWWIFGTLMLIVAVPASILASDRTREQEVRRHRELLDALDDDYDYEDEEPERVPVPQWEPGWAPPMGARH